MLRFACHAGWLCCVLCSICGLWRFLERACTPAPGKGAVCASLWQLTASSTSPTSGLTTRCAQGNCSLYLCLSVCLSPLCLSVCLSLSPLCLSIRPSVCLSLFSVFLSVCRSLSVCLSVGLSLSLCVFLRHGNCQLISCFQLENCLFSTKENICYDSFFLSFFFKAWKSAKVYCDEKVEASESSQTEVFSSYSRALKWLYSCSQPHAHPHPPLPPCLSEYVCHLSCCTNTVVYSFTKLERDPDCWRCFCHCLYLFVSLCFHFSGTTAQTLLPILSPSLTMTQTTGGCSVIACTFLFHCLSIAVGLLHKHCGLFFCCLFLYQARTWPGQLQAIP